MRINILRARKIKKYYVCLNENEIRIICKTLNEKAEKLQYKNDSDSKCLCRKFDRIIIKLTGCLNKKTHY